MNTTTTDTAEVLNDLLRINIDRIEGYEKAASQTKDEDADLRTMFMSMAEQSQSIASELRRHLSLTDEEPVKSSTAAGKLYRTWMDLKVVFTGKDRKAILESCEFGEDAAQKAYQSALEDSGDLPANVRAMLIDQQQSLKQSHDQVRNLRNLEKK